MRTFSKSADQLAALGGKPIFTKPPVVPWPPINKTTEAALVALYRSRKWSWTGPWEQKFNADFARLHTAKHTVMMANGTVTLEGALHVLGVGRGDEVIVPALTWPATAMAALYLGAKPVFVDIEPDTLCLDPDAVAAAITPRTKAIIPVHLYGSMADLDRLQAVARQHGLPVIEDCAHAHGGLWNGRGLGSLGAIGSFSFQQSKTVACGESGAVITNHTRLADRLFLFKHIGYNAKALPGRAGQRPPPDLVCHNYRGTEFHAAVLHGQLAGLPALTVHRNRAADYLTHALEQIPGVKVQARGRKASRHRQSYYAFLTIIDRTQWAGATHTQIVKALHQEGFAPATGTYGSVYRHTLWNIPPSQYRIHGGYRDQHGPGCRVSEEIGTARVVGFLHQYLDLPQIDLDKIIAAFAKVQRHATAVAKIK